MQDFPTFIRVAEGAVSQDVSVGGSLRTGSTGSGIVLLFRGFQKQKKKKKK